MALHPLFVQIHTLTSYPGTLLNRDDVGFAKRLPFGGVTRTRISSQCLKRHWRTFDGEGSLVALGGGTETMSVRSRQSFEMYVYRPLIEQGIRSDVAIAATEAIKTAVLGESAKARKEKEAEKAEDAPQKKGKKKAGADSGGASLHTGQVTVLGQPELKFCLAEALEIAKAANGSVEAVAKEAARFRRDDWKKNRLALKRGAGLDTALFGRMVTSDKLSRCDAAVHVAHAFTVHRENSEPDYFTAVDDLQRSEAGGQLGSALVATTELTSGLFYGYVVVDVAQLVSNLEGGPCKAWRDADRKLAADVTATLIGIVSRVSPGAKKGSTAPYSRAHCTLVEAGTAQPRTLANAFLQPVAVWPNLIENAYKAIESYVNEVDHVFGEKNRRALAALGPKAHLEKLAPSTTIADVAKFAADAILEHRQ
jgi:CRISPR system Cascade subunit CasC